MAKEIISEELRNLIKERDGYCCVDCHGTERLEIHHVYPEAYGGKTVPNNLVLLCKECHSQRHVEYQVSYYDMFLLKFKNFWNKILGKPTDNQLKPILFWLTGQDKFRKYQENVIEDVLHGKDVLFVSPTGSGKSICFQIPGILLKNMVLVITPLKALMKNQVEGLWKKRVLATYINSDLVEGEKKKRLALIQKNLFKFLYVAPEQFYLKDDDYQLKSHHQLLHNHYDLMVIDEAHCIDKWGRHFRPAYEKLVEIKDQINGPRVIALTASASVEVQKRIVKSLGLVNPSIYVTGFYRPEIDLYVKIYKNSEVGDNEKINDIEKIIKKNLEDKIIIFVPTIKIGERLWKELTRRDIEAAFYYGNLNVADKTRIQDEYVGIIKSDLKVLICTSAFGMGINIKDIRMGIHWTITPNIEDYYQQMGRIGRDGKKSQAYLLYAPGDEGLIRYINNYSLKNSKKSNEEKERIAKIFEGELQTMLRYVGTAMSKWDFILNYFGEKTFLKKVSIPWKLWLLIGFIVWLVSKSFLVALIWMIVLEFIRRISGKE